MGRYFGWDGYDAMVADWMDAGWDYDKCEKKLLPLPDDFPEDKDVLFASYGLEEEYQGEGIVIYERDGKLYEASGNHCSCSGLEGQWSPTQVTWKALAGYQRGWGDDARRPGLGRDHTQEASDAFAALVRARLPAEDAK